MSRAEKSAQEQMTLLKRGAADLVEEQELLKRIEEAESAGRPLTVKTGFDPTAPDLHLGHTVLLRKMRHFQQCGHRVIFLIGDFTGLIGDPTGKKATRPQLSKEEVEANAETYLEQVTAILDREKTVVEYNSRWLRALGAEGIVRLAGSYTLARMMERDDFKSRFAEHKPISIHELLYPLCQGYDSIELKADVELGGHDQIFNLLVGRDLMRERGLAPQCVLTVPLLVGTDGKDKMSKSLGNAIGVADAPRDMFGKTMSIPDSLMWDWMLLLTDISEAEIARQRRDVESGDLHPRDVKASLGATIVEQYHGAKAAAEAREEFRAIFSKGAAPDDVPVASIAAGSSILEVLDSQQLAKSRSEGRRLLQQGAVSLDGERISDPFFELQENDGDQLLKVGKRRFLRIAVQ